MANLKKNISYNFMYQLLILILPLITAPYLSRVLGADGIGIYSYSYSIALYFTYITMLGLNNYGNRAIASVQNDFEKRSRVFWEIYFLQLICFMLSICGYCIYIKFFTKNKVISGLMGILVISSAFDINWFYFGMEKFRLTVIRNSIVKILAVICIFIGVKQKEDINLYIAIMSISYFISQIMVWPFLKKYVHFVKVNLADIRKHIRPNLILFVPVIAVSIYKIMDKVMIGLLASSVELGYYENAEKIISVPVALITAIGTVMLPRMTALLAEKKYAESRKYINLTMTIVLAFANAILMGFIAIAEEFSTLFFGPEFNETGVIIQVLAITILFLGIGNVVRSQYLIPYRKDKVYIQSAIIGAIINIIINLIFIRRLGAIGAAIGTVCAEFSVCFYQIYFVKDALELKSYIKQEIVFLVIALCMYSSIKLLPLIEGNYLSLMVKIGVGGMVYSILCVVYLKIRYLHLIKQD